MNKVEFRIDQPNTLIQKVDELLKKYGARDFLHSDEEECHKGKEAFFLYFFVIGFRKLSGKDLWIYQPKEFPDLCLVSFNERQFPEVLQYELVMIPEHYKEIGEMVKNVTDKIERKQYSPDAPCGLLVFSNNTLSKVFEEKLYQILDKIHPFTEVWTTHLEFSNNMAVKKIVISKVRPFPIIRFNFDGDNQSLYRNQAPVDSMELIQEGDTRFFKIKKEARDELQKEAIRRRLKSF